MQTYPGTSHLTFNFGRYGHIQQQFSQAAIAVVTTVGTDVAVAADVDVERSHDTELRDFNAAVD